MAGGKLAQLLRSMGADASQRDGHNAAAQSGRHRNLPPTRDARLVNSLPLGGGSTRKRRGVDAPAAVAGSDDDEAPKKRRRRGSKGRVVRQQAAGKAKKQRREQGPAGKAAAGHAGGQRAGGSQGLVDEADEELQEERQKLLAGRWAQTCAADA